MLLFNGQILAEAEPGLIKRDEDARDYEQGCLSILGS